MSGDAMALPERGWVCGKCDFPETLRAPCSPMKNGMACRQTIRFLFFMVIVLSHEARRAQGLTGAGGRHHGL